MDAICLSTARMVTTGRIAADNGWRLIMVGLLANIVFKGGLTAMLGHRRLFARIAPLYVITIAAGALLLLLSAWGWLLPRNRKTRSMIRMMTTMVSRIKLLE